MSKTPKIFVKPASEGLVVRDPVNGRQLKGAGEWKPKNTYWVRRLGAKDVVETTPPKDAPASAPSGAGK